MSPATIKMPTIAALLTPVLGILKQSNGPMAKLHVYAKLKQMYPPSVFTDARKFQTRLSWAFSYLKMYKAADNKNRGLWGVTLFGVGLGPEEIDTIISVVRKRLRTKEIFTAKAAAKKRRFDGTSRSSIKALLHMRDHGILTQIDVDRALVRITEQNNQLNNDLDVSQ